MPELGKQFKLSVPLHDLTQGFGPDVYDNLYKYIKSPVIHDIIKITRNDPSKRTRLHVIVPTGTRGVNPGDTGTLDREYAAAQGRATMPDGFRVVTKNVSARELFTDGDLSKWTWNPPKETK